MAFTAARSVIFTGSVHDRVHEPRSRPAEEEVDLHVHQPGDQRELGELEDVVGIGERAAARANVDDPTTFDADIPTVGRFACVDVYNAAGAYNRHSGPRHRALILPKRNAVIDE